MRSLAIACAIAVLLGAPLPLLAADETSPQAGAFVPTGSLTAGRNDHTATPLMDGRVLIAGGGDKETRATAEVWDPATGRFEPAGALVKARKSHTATRLSDGRVLLVGGSRATAKTEIWDPATSSSEASGRLIRGRNGHTATLLDDGRVLVVGGWARPGWLRSAEVWDPATASFTPTGSLAQPRTSHTATLLPDGRVLVIGGHGADQYATDDAGNLLYPDEPRALAEVWDPDTGAFSAAGTLNHPRSQQTAALLDDGRVLVAGGWGRDGDPAQAEVWDPSTSSFAPAGWLIDGGGLGTATALPGGRVLVVGGTAAELWEPSLAAFVPAGSLATERWPHSATLLDDGRVLVVGGRGRKARASAEVWEPRPLTEAQARDLAEDSLVCGEPRESFRQEGTTRDPERDEEYLDRCLTCEELFSAIQFARIADFELGLTVYRQRCDADFPLLPGLTEPADGD